MFWLVVKSKVLCFRVEDRAYLENTPYLVSSSKLIRTCFIFTNVVLQNESVDDHLAYQLRIDISRLAKYEYPK